MREAESKHPNMEKKVFAVVYAARATSNPLKKVLQGPKEAGRLILWAV